MSLVSRLPAVAAIDDRMIAAMRLVLAMSASLIIYLDPAEPNRFVAIIYTMLALYVAYSSILVLLSWRQRPLLQSIHWVDVAWYVVLIGLSSGTNSIFFIFFYFAILVSSFQRGFRAGVQVTLVSATLFTVVGYLTIPPETDFELNRFLLRALSLLVLGYMMAFWGGSEVESKRRLAFLKDVSALSNPRFGIDRMLNTILERLRVFYAADACLLITHEPSLAQYHLRRADQQALKVEERQLVIPEEIARLFLAFPPDHTLVYPPPFALWGWWRRSISPAAAAPDEMTARAEHMRGVLGVWSFITVPYRRQGEVVGRLYVASRRQRIFKASEGSFLFQILDHTMPMLDYIRLVDRLALEAAEAERERIARDLHDSIIQPYIGFQMGLAAIAQKLTLGQTDIKADVTRLLQLTEAGITDLRRYVGGVRAGSMQEGGFLQALRRFNEKFSAASGIVVHLEVADELPINDRLATEMFHMITEGMSNIRRHTSSPWAKVCLGCENDHVLLRIENASEEAPLLPFTPRSLTERAEALGGQVHVEWKETGTTSVCIDIPL